MGKIYGHNRSSMFRNANKLIMLSVLLLSACSPARNAVPISLAIPVVIPAPDPLPTIVFRQQSSLVKIVNQLLGIKNRLPNPERVLADGQKVAESIHLEFYMEKNYFPVDITWWQQQAEQIYEYVSTRTNTTISTKIIVAFLQPQTGNCTPRGITYNEQEPIILIFADQETSREQVFAAFAHELGHVFFHQKFEGSGDAALNEGMATWAAGNYWLAWKGASFDDSVRLLLNNGTYLPLFQNYELSLAYEDTPGCLIRRDDLLTELASFMDFLIRTYGIEKMSEIFKIQQPRLVGAQNIIYPPDYKGVYGFELNQLEMAWLISLDGK
jgi:hypothetical protein